MTDCVFCDIVAGRTPAEIVCRWDDALCIEPLNPVVDGHVLVLPTVHVESFFTDPEVSAATMRRAAQLVAGDSNVITSVGRAATQTVFHLHVHVVPRFAGDGLPLPWTPQQEALDAR